MRNNIKSLAAVAAIIIVAALILAWWRERPITVEAHVMQRGTAIQAVYATGTVEPTISIPISPRVAGRLVELRVDEGSEVHKGQLLARLEDADLQSTVNQLEAQERWAKQSYDRAASMFEKGAGTAADRDQAYSNWQAAQAATAHAREQQKFMVLTAPGNGIVTRRDGEIGQYIAVNQVLMQIATDAPLRISADVDEEDIAKVKAGQLVSIRADAFPDEVFDGHVIEVTPQGDTTTRSYRVRISVPRDSPLHIGMTTDTNIIVDKHDDVNLLPATAIVDDQGNKYAWVIKDQRLHRIPVTIGINGDRKVEVLKGVAANEPVVDIALPDFREGQKAEIHSAKTA